MDWIRKHADSLVTIGVVVGAALWMNSSLHSLKDELGDKLNDLDRRLIRIETVLVMKDMLPKELLSAAVKERQ